MGKEILGSLELNRIYQFDCLEGMKLLPDNSINLVVIDPPYNIGKDKRWDKVDNYIKWMGDVFKEIERVLKYNGSFYFFHNDFRVMAELDNAIKNTTGFAFKQFIVWNKRFNEAKNKGFLDGFIEVEGLRNYQKMTEYILYYTFQDDVGITTKEIDKNNFPSLRRYFKEYQEALGLSLKKINESLGHRRAEHGFYWKSSQWDMPTEETYGQLLDLPLKDDTFIVRDWIDLKNEYEDLKYTYNNQKTHHSVWDYEIAKKEGHITPKPVELIQNILLHSSNEGDVILDCFMGSGTTAVASQLSNRKWIGFERESEYIEIANKRLDNILR